MNKKLTTLLLLGFAIGDGRATDARSYVLVPVGSVLTEFRYVDSTSTWSGVPHETILKTGVSSLKNTYYFDWLGDLAALQITLPYATARRELGQAHTNESGFGDPSVLLGWGIYGMPALSIAEYKSWRQQGFSSAITAQLTLPLGEYNNKSALNVGGNRYVQRYELQGAWRRDGLIVEVLGGFSYFGNNTAYLGQNTLGQKPLYHAESHLSYNLTSRFWVSLDSFYTKGGELLVNGVSRQNEQRSVAGGGTLAYKLADAQFLKVIFQNTVSRSDSSPKFLGAAISYNVLW